MVDATAPMENNHTTPTALGPQLEDPPMAATAWAVAAAVLVVAMVAVGATAAGAHRTVLAEELVAATIAEAEATRIATSPTNHVAATMPATELKRFVAKRHLKQITATTSPLSPLDFATYFFLKNSSL
jgi:acyl-coenzyme A synthetase/AMP-(fatty) acid ligase